MVWRPNHKIRRQGGATITKAGKVNPKEIEKDQWWLMWCDFPNLNWAHLRVFANG